MAYDKAILFEQAKQVTVEHNLFFVEDIVAYLPCSKSTFYEYYPDGSDELDDLKSLLSINRTKLKVSMRAKWENNPAPALQMALMKLICTDEERKKLSMTYNETEHSGSILTTVHPQVIESNVMVFSSEKDVKLD